MLKLSIDTGTEAGTIKPLHGMNNAARLTPYGKILSSFFELRPPIVRLHDTGGPYGGCHYVDVPNIFPDFSADPDDPASYDFTLTDRYIGPLIDAGIQIMYRLGVTIEHAPKKYRIFPPEDPEKWADVCEHIVRHYNRGWADGHECGIKYWEIWNEPDGFGEGVEPYGPPNWTGTREEYYALYTAAARRIKDAHPEVMVGGYSSCFILGSFIGGRWIEGDTGFFTGFLDHIISPEGRAPLDFFSFHGYVGRHNIDKTGREAAFVRRTLDSYGFTDALIFDDEWSGLYDDGKDVHPQSASVNMRTHKGAALNAATLAVMQSSPVDAAMYYEAQLWRAYGGLYHVPSLEPTPAYDVFSAFARLYEMRTAVPCGCEPPLYAAAAKDAEKCVCLASLTDEGPETVTFCIPGAETTPVTVRVTDSDGERTETVCPETGVNINGPGVLVCEFDAEP